jgi:IS5 family transposase
MFLEEMEQVVPWGELCALIEPHYPKPGNGRRRKELEKMLRIYFLQQCFNLADPAVEEALYDSATLRQFVGIDLEPSRCRMRRRCASSGTCWKRTIWGKRFWGR